ncbi:MAG: HD domain-containing protein [Candidatus Hydrogenedentes bacterium]|nr:HD domain-containing protein [Candidatus Hydrogenedentota bacterium]
MTFSDRIVEAFAFTHGLHQQQRRKGSEVPYLTHLMAVAALVGEYGGNESQVIGALLHDAVEDQGGQETLERIRAKFGDEVAGYVAGCSDADGEPKPPWEERKRRFLKSVTHAPSSVKLIVAADKLHNARSILKDFRELGDAVWQRFRGGREGSLWYYSEMVRALATGWSHPILLELSEAVDALQCAANAASNR